MRAITGWMNRWLGIGLLAAFCATAAAAQGRIEDVEQTQDGTRTDLPTAVEIEAIDQKDMPNPAPVPLNPRKDRRDVVEFGHSYHLGPDDTAQEVVIFGGNAHIEGQVRGNVVVLGGDAIIDGRISGNVVAVGGNVSLGVKARVHENAVSVGGTVSTNPGHKISGKIVSFPVGNLFGFPLFGGRNSWLGYWPFLGHTPFVILILSFLLPLALYMAIAALFPRALQQGSTTVANSPIKALFAGILGMLLTGPIVLLLLISIVGILAIPFVTLGLLAAFLFGKAAVYRYAGGKAGSMLRPQSALHVVWAVALGFLLLRFIGWVPLLGGVVSFLVAAMGFGAVLLMVFSGNRQKPPLGTILPPTPKPYNPATPSSVPPIMPTPPPMPPPAASAMTGTVASQFAEAQPATPVLRSEPLLPPLMPLTSTPSEPALAGHPPGMPPIPPISNSPLPPLPPLEPPPIIPMASVIGAAAAASIPKGPLVAVTFWKRLWAALIDGTFVSAVAIFILPHFMTDDPNKFTFWLVAYFAGIWAWRGTSLGGIIMQLQVVRLDGQPLKPEVAIIRAVAAVLSALPLGLGFIWCAWDAKGQTWHDKIAGTIVISAPTPQSLI